MNNEQIQQELTIIKTMINKTRRETAESGHFFISIGISSICAVFIINFLEKSELHYLIIPFLAILVIINGIIGLLTIGNKAKKQRVESYSKTICYSIWIACVVPTVMVLFLFPLLKLYSWELTSVFISMIIGIAIFTTGVIFESRFITLSSFAWWLGAVAMAFIENIPRMWIMITIIFIGWVVPGIFLNKKYRDRS